VSSGRGVLGLELETLAGGEYLSACAKDAMGPAGESKSEGGNGRDGKYCPLDATKQNASVAICGTFAIFLRMDMLHILALSMTHRDVLVALGLEAGPRQDGQDSLIGLPSWAAAKGCSEGRQRLAAAASRAQRK